MGAYCRELVMTGRAEGAMSDKQLLCMFKSFHGSPGYASFAKQLMDGKGVFKEAFERYPIENNREGNGARGGTGNAEMLELREILHCRQGKIYAPSSRVSNTIAPNKLIVMAQV